MSKIKWGQRCIARRFEAVQGVARWDFIKEKFINQECIVYRLHQDGSASVSFEKDGNGDTYVWLPSALEPIPEVPGVWWPKLGESVMHDGKVKTVTDRCVITHQLDHDKWVHVQNLSPVTTTEITPEEAVKLLEQHTGKSFTIKSK
jgi:hypothetical protein